MSLPDFLLEASRVLIGLGLAVFIGGPLSRLLAGASRGEGEAAKDGNGEKKKIFLEREEGNEDAEGQRLGKARFVAAGALLVGVLLETQVLGSSLPPRHVGRAGILFLLVASLVYSVMAIQPRARYYDERSLTFEENLRQPWVSRAHAARRRAARLDFFGFLLALAALLLG